MVLWIPAVFSLIRGGFLEEEFRNRETKKLGNTEISGLRAMRL